MKSKYHQSGMTTLLITSMLLIVALLLSLASYKSLFYQIKRTQNEVLARKAHWAAEGGLECGFSEIQNIKGIPIGGFNDCGSLALDSLSVLVGTPNILVSEKNGTILKKAFSTPGAGSSGTIKSTSNIYFVGGVSTYPDPGKSLGNNKWQCTVLRYAKHLKIRGPIENKGLHKSVPPYFGFPVEPTDPIQNCIDTHKTSGVIGNHDLPEGLNQDFIKDIYLEPFKDTFDVPRDDWLDVMYNEEFVRIGDDLPLSKPQTNLLPPPSFNNNCGEKVKFKIAQGNDLIWVYGGCHITDSELDAIDTASKNLDGVILVIQDGIFSTKGDHSFKGMIYHFITSASSYSPTLSDWEKTENLLDLTRLVDFTPDVVTDITVTDVSYYQDGTFNPLGGYVMDGPNTYAVFRTSMSFKFNRDVMDKPLNKIRKIKWIKGSWNDL